MEIDLRKGLHLPLFLLVSFIAHAVGGYALSRFGSYDFTRPVTASFAVDLKQAELGLQPARNVVPGPVRHEYLLAKAPATGKEDRTTAAGAETEKDENDTSTKGEWTSTPEMGPVGLSANRARESKSEKEGDAEGAPISGPSARVEKPPRVLEDSQFVTAVREKLSYQVSLYGMPVGEAALNAVNGEGEIRITLTARSNPLISGFYPVEDFSETRIIGGNYIISRTRQREGALRSDTGFTLCLRERSVIWTDRMTNAVISHSLEDADALDIISGFYHLRSLPLQAGETVLLNIFDNDSTLPTPVEVLRRESIHLPGVGKADALVIRPSLQTDGLFKRSGNVLVWLTDDEYRVPVRLEVTTALGRVTAELVSAEAER